MPPKRQLKWRCSYETFLYDTPDGDLDLGQYAEHPNGEDYCIRTDDKGRWNTRKVPRDTFNTMGMTKVNIIPDTKAVYDEFLTPAGKIVRVRSDRQKYLDRRDGKNKEIPAMEKTDAEIASLEQ